MRAHFDFSGHGESEVEFMDMTAANGIEDSGEVRGYTASLDFVSDVFLPGIHTETV